MRVSLLSTLAIAVGLNLAACERGETPTLAPEPGARPPAEAPAPSLPTPPPAPAQPPASTAPSGLVHNPPTVVPGPVEGARVSEGYARLVARDAYVWAWPLINLHTKRQAFAQAQEPGLLGGILPIAPLNRLAMLSDYVDPQQRFVACPNQDVVYGGGVLALDQSPVVIQVPDFGERFWVYQLVDLRTDSFAELGAVYGSKPGFYLLVGPDWNGEIPAGIVRAFRSPTNTGFVAPRVFQSDTPADKAAVQAVIQGIDMYPLAMFDGTMKTRDWRQAPKCPQPAGSGGAAETRWVFPDKFLEQLPQVLDDAPPLPGEAARYAQLRSLINAAAADEKLRAAIVDEATRAERELVAPLLEFRRFGLPLPYHWTTIDNGAAFGTDYFTRTAVARSNILVNKADETKYFYQDLDATGARLSGSKRYMVTFPKDQLPPVRGFWSLTLYNAQHFFAPNAIKRYSVGTKNRHLKPNADGSLTIYVQADEPTDPLQRANWLPAPKGEDISLYLRVYWPEEPIDSGRWTPPAVRVVQHRSPDTH